MGASAQFAPVYPARVALMERAEAALVAGDAQSASDDFERAAMMLHAADTEMGLVRAAMQMGQYRRALAFMAHTAGAHLDMPASAALYAWLLRAGGQDLVAQRVMAEALKRSPGSEALIEADRALGKALPVASGVLLATPARVAPWPVVRGDGLAPPAHARVVGSGMLLAGGRMALVPADMATAGAECWLRNGLGETVVARPATEQPLRSRGVLLLVLDAPLDAPGVRVAARDAFGGTPAFSAAHAPSSSADAAWPWLLRGFVAALGSDGRQGLAIDLPAGAQGGPVLDAGGAVIGVALQDAAGKRWMLPASAWREFAAAPASDGALAPRVTADQAYEVVLRATLQVIVAASP